MVRKSPRKILAGDRVYNGSLKGVVVAIDKHKAIVAWDFTLHLDVIDFDSPLWMFLQYKDEITDR